MPSPEQIRDVLLKAAELIEPEGAWCQGTFARDVDGEFVRDIMAPEACQWCAWGGIEKACLLLRLDIEDDGDAAVAAVEAALEPRASIGMWNDAEYRRQADVVAKLREAAERVMAVAQ